MQVMDIRTSVCTPQAARVFGGVSKVVLFRVVKRNFTFLQKPPAKIASHILTKTVRLTICCQAETTNLAYLSNILPQSAPAA